MKMQIYKSLKSELNFKPVTLRLLFAAIFILISNCFFAQQKTVADSVEIYLNNNKHLRALEFAKKQSDRYLSEKRFFEFSKMTLRETDVLLTLNDNQKAVKVLLDALKLVQKNNAERSEIVLLDRLGTVYVKLNQLERAKKYYHSAISKARKIKNDSLIGRLAQPLYRIHYNTNSDSASYYLGRTLDYSKKLGTPAALTTTYTNHFAYYHSKGDDITAKKYLDSSLHYARESGSKHKLSIALSNLVYYQMMVQQDYPLAKKTYAEIFALTPNDTTSRDAADIYQNYSYLLEQLNDHKGANEYLNKALGILDATFNEQTSRAIRDLEVRYQIEKVEEEYLQKQKELEENQSKNKKIFAVFIALLILSLILFYFFHQNTKLKQNNKLKDIESRLQQNIINATIDGQENERKKIAAVLHDNISAMLSSAGLQLSAFVAGNPAPSEEIAKTRAILKETHDKVRDLSHELVPVLLSKFGLHYAVQDLCEKNSNAVIKVTCNLQLAEKKRFEDEYEMKVYFIITELINNIIKHSRATDATLILVENDASLTITAIDNGIGFDATKPHISEGFGLTQIRARVSNMKGSLAINSKPNSGTSVKITIPVPA